VTPEAFQRVTVPEVAEARPVCTAVAAPALEPGSLRGAVAALAAIAEQRAVDRLALVLAPDAVDAAVPVLSAALDEHPDLTVDLVPTDDPAALLRGGVVLVGDVDADLAAHARRLGVAIVT
jgi:hypothetical protein